jgi:hypothetical protein
MRIIKFVVFEGLRFSFLFSNITIGWNIPKKISHVNNSLYTRALIFGKQIKVSHTQPFIVRNIVTYMKSLRFLFYSSLNYRYLIADWNM